MRMCNNDSTRQETIMSAISSYNGAFDFQPGRTKGTRRGLLSKVRLIAEAMREGHAAARRYRELTAGGMPHDKAAAQLFAELYPTG
jgi:hypothetical protein